MTCSEYYEDDNKSIRDNNDADDNFDDDDGNDDDDNDVSLYAFICTYDDDDPHFQWRYV